MNEMTKRVRYINNVIHTSKYTNYVIVETEYKEPPLKPNIGETLQGSVKNR